MSPDPVPSSSPAGTESRSPASGPASPGGGRGASWATGISLLFLFLSLLALALIPSYLDQEVSRVREQNRGVLGPAEAYAAQIEGAHARQIAALHPFVLSGDGRFRQRYRSAREEEFTAMESLQGLVGSMALEVRGETAGILDRVQTLSFSWDRGHRDLLSMEAPSSDSLRIALDDVYLERLATEQAIYEELRAATQDLRQTLSAEAARGEARMANARAFQIRLIRWLGVLGLAATLVVVLLGFRLRKLMRESEIRRAEALRARREADALLRATGDGVLGMDREGRCTFLNRAGVELLGYPTRLVTGRDVHDLLHHSHADGTPHPRESCPMIRALVSGEAYQSRTETLWRAGREPFPVQVVLRPLKDGGETKGAVLTFTDMTETRAAEGALRNALQARDEVLAVVSHDLRNPVSTIFSAAGLLLEFDPPPERAREHLLAVQRSAQRMNLLIQDLLDVARLEAGGLNVAPASISVPDLLQEIVDTQGARADEKGVRLRSRIGKGLREGWGDRDRLVQVLTNLVENALKFTQPDGTIELAAENSPEGGDLWISVSDTGVGISPEDQERLFDRFWQVSRRDSDGAGLGLAIVKGIVEAHGGRVWVESGVGEGSRFWFSLPAGPEKETGL